MQKKIGILTFHNSVNYGAALQAYALSKTLENDGYEVEIIDYCNEKIDNELKSKGQNESKDFKGKIKGYIKRYHGNRKLKYFSDFNEKRLNLSSKKKVQKNSINLVCDNYDVYVTGSDQVWNLELTGHDYTYYLDFVSSRAIRIAYAVSVGDFVNTDISEIIPYIRKFKAISVRENFFHEVLRREYSIDSVVCCDPTLLADTSIFSEIKSKRIINRKYVFCFLMEKKPKLMEIAKRVALENNYVLIDNKTSFQFFLHSSPENFLSWIFNAEFILTDSFHGTVFSILFKKPFLSDKYDGEGRIKKRVNDLLKTLSLEKHFVEMDIENINELKRIIREPIDYDYVNNKRTELAKQSHEWLLSSIEA